jgi:hypothetical protein
MGLVMLHNNDLRTRELIAERHVKYGFHASGKWPHNRNARDLIAPDAGQPQTFRDSRLRDLAGIRSASQFVLFDGSLQLAVVQNGARGIAE